MHSICVAHRELVTPSKAKKYLEGNTNNRRISRDRVRSYARDMLQGEWQEWNPQNVLTITESGRLLDGQHRLLAVIRANKAIEFEIAIVSDAEEPILDRGRPRSIRDTATMRCLPPLYRNYAVLGAASLFYRIENGKSSIPSDNAVISFISKYEDRFTRVSSCFDRRTSQKYVKMRRAAICAGIFCADACGVPYDVLYRFCEVVMTGFCEGEAEYSAIVFQRQLLTSFAGRSNYASQVAEFSSIQEAINDFWLHRSRKRSYSGTALVFYNKIKPLMEAK